MSVIYTQNDHVFKVVGLKNQQTLAYINDATVKVTILDASGSSVRGCIWPLEMSYVAASDGDYSVTLPNTMILSNGRTYTLSVEVVSDGSKSVWKTPIEAQTRSVTLS